MIPLPVVLLAAAAAFAAGALAGRYDLAAWVLHLYARALGAWWFTPAQACPKCGRAVHLMRSHPDRAGIFGIADGGGRCLGCSGRTPRNAPQDAPGATEERPEVPPSISGWLNAGASDSGPHKQDRDDERSDQ